MPIGSVNCSAADQQIRNRPSSSHRPHFGAPRPIIKQELTWQREPHPDSDIYQIKVTLLGTKPPIWRRLLVPADVTLAQLHNVLQIAMGWEDGHMHEFRVGQRRFGQPEPADPFMRMPAQKASAPLVSPLSSEGRAPR